METTGPDGAFLSSTPEPGWFEPGKRSRNGLQGAPDRSKHLTAGPGDGERLMIRAQLRLPEMRLACAHGLG